MNRKCTKNDDPICLLRRIASDALEIDVDNPVCKLCDCSLDELDSDARRVGQMLNPQAQSGRNASRVDAAQRAIERAKRVARNHISGTDELENSLATLNRNPTNGSASAGTRFGGYEIVREIGRGGMGVVYEARHAQLGRKVALKVLPDFALRSETRTRRFQREARAASQLHHTNIVPVFEVGEENNVPFYAMQLIDGVSLNELRSGDADTLKANTTSTVNEGLGRRSCNTSDKADSSTVRKGSRIAESTRDRILANPATASHRFVAEMGKQAANALAHAHEHGVIHRDVKPSNLLLDENATVWLADFGLAKKMDDDLTGTTEAPGTLRYMSPERFRGVCNEKSDVYGLGITLYELLTKRPAFDATDSLSLLKQVNDDEPAAPRSIDPSIPRDLETIVSKAMAKEPDKRYASASLLADDLTRFLAGDPIHARPVGNVERLWLWAKKHRPWPHHS